MFTIRSSRHSNATGAAATRGARTRSDAAEAIPNFSNSLSPYGSSAAQAFICSASRRGTRLITNSGTASMLRTVSFFCPWRLFTGTNISVGGFAHTPWKKLKGARLVFPSAEIVEAQAMGRGIMVVTIHW